MKKVTIKGLNVKETEVWVRLNFLRLFGALVLLGVGCSTASSFGLLSIRCTPVYGESRTAIVGIPFAAIAFEAFVLHPFSLHGYEIAYARIVSGMLVCPMLLVCDAVICGFKSYIKRRKSIKNRLVDLSVDSANKEGCDLWEKSCLLALLLVSYD